jgi:hypothetical protein
VEIFRIRRSKRITRKLTSFYLTSSMRTCKQDGRSFFSDNSDSCFQVNTDGFGLINGRTHRTVSSPKL